MRPVKLVLAPSVLLLSFAFLGASSDTHSIPQSPQDAAQPVVPTVQVYSRETIVDVIVTDAEGQPIRDLKASDFTVTEDGRPQAVRSFQEFSAGTSTKGRPLPLLPLGVHTNYQASPTTGPVNILLIDALHSRPAQVVRSLRSSATYINRMPKGTQVAVFWLSASGLHLLQGFTSDPAQLLDAVHTNRTDIGSDQDRHAIDWYTIDALQQIAQYVAPIRGRKNLLWLTPGMPVQLTRDGGYGWAGAHTSAPNTNVAAANALNVAENSAIPGYRGVPDPFVSSLLYGGTVDDWTFGIPNNNFTGAAAPFYYGSGASFSAPTSLGSVFGGGPGIDMGMVHRLMDTYEMFTAEQIAVSPIDPSGASGGLGNSQLAAEEVAEQSGGIARFNSNDLTGSISEAISEGSHFYTLSYVPPRRKPDGHYHSIHVAVTLPGAHLVYRKGYNAEDPKPPAQLAGPALIQAALKGKTPTATQILFDASLQPAPAVSTAPTPGRAAQRTPYDLLLAVPQSQIASAENPDGTHTVKLQFAFDAYDNRGKFLGSHAQNLDLALTPERYQQFVKSPVTFHEQVWFYPGPLFVRVGVFDAVSNKVGTVEIPLTIPKQNP